MFTYTRTCKNTYICNNCSVLSRKQHILMYQFCIINIAFLNSVISPVNKFLEELVYGVGTSDFCSLTNSKLQINLQVIY